MNEIIEMITEELIKADIEIKEPPMYRVIILNDPVTPMIFVVQVLMEIFHKDRKTADEIMISAHKNGSAICGVYPYEIAETKVNQVKSISTKNRYPLRCLMEEE